MTYYGVTRRKFVNKTLIFCTIFFFIWFLIVWRYTQSSVIFNTDTNKDLFSSGNDKTINYYEELIKQDESEIIPGLGDSGQGVQLKGADAEIAKKQMKKEAFNLLLSNRIAYNRTILDARHPRCLKKRYENNLPTASVVIIFTNERWSPLIRTIYSVLNRTPQKLLKEIILVDDASDHDELKGKLDYYIRTRFPRIVKLYRLKERSGLIRARLHGAKQATGDVLIFLDAHCEVGIQWIEPLVDRIKEDRRHVVVPIIDVIDDFTFEYQHNGGSYDFEVGGFTWNGHFTWIQVSSEEKIRRKTPEAPTRSPTMAGGLFAIDRMYFWEIGSYDEDMDVWGGENLEISFRVWQCGGILETIPCSRVGHIFRSFHPYSFPGNKDTHGINTARTVLVWMDEYKRLFFQHRPDLIDKEIGDVSKRLDLRKKLNCKSFSWYLRNVYKEKFIPDENVEAYGRVKLRFNNYCLDNLQQNLDEKFNLGLYPCHDTLYASQYFSLSLDEELREESACAEVPHNKQEVVMVKCTGSPWQKWKRRKNGEMVYLRTGECLDASDVPSGGTVRVAACDHNSPTQRWVWDNLCNESS